MRTRIPLLLFLAFVSPAAAQGRATRADPVSGDWISDGRTLLRLTLAENKVTGTVIVGRPNNLTEVKTGSFDPATGMLRLQGDTKDPDTGAPVQFLVVGKINSDTLRATATFGERVSEKVLVRTPQKPESELSHPVGVALLELADIGRRDLIQR